MNEPILPVRVAPDPSGRLRVLAPGVGWWSRHPHPGALLGPGSALGIFSCLNRTFVLVLPDGAAGRATASLPRDRAVAVEYAQVLFEMSPVGPGEIGEVAADAVALGHPSHAGLPEGTRGVLAPTDGFFYRRPSPEARPFVEVGDRVRAGQPVGLVEVMKTFNQILYGGPGFPEEAEVIEVRAADGKEVHAGEILVLVR
jgi:acetyl-CoA carboxylase biotin carboxyl carrier protein